MLHPSPLTPPPQVEFCEDGHKDVTLKLWGIHKLLDRLPVALGHLHYVRYGPMTLEVPEVADHRRIPFRLSEKEAEVMDVISEYCREVNKQFQQGRRYCPTLPLTSSLHR